MWTTDTLEWIDIELTSFCNTPNVKDVLENYLNMLIKSLTKHFLI